MTDRLTFLDHAATSPVPVRVFRAVQQFYRERMGLGELGYEKWVKATDEVRELAAKLLKASRDEIAILHNTSEGINVVAYGLKWRKGNSVVTTDLEFPSNLYPWFKLRERGVKVKMVKHRADGTISLKDVERMIDDSTRLIAISHVQWLNGFKIDLEALKSVAEGRCLLFVDAIQSLGATPVEARLTDFISAGGGKWLLAPHGVSIFYVNKDVELSPLFVGWASAEEPDKFSPTLKLTRKARRFEIGCLDYSGVYGLRAALKLLLEVGIPQIQRRLIELGDLIIKGADRLKLKIQTPRDIGCRAGIVNIKVNEADRVVKRLAEAGVVVSARMNGVRASPHFYNNEGDIERFIMELGRAIR